MKLILSISHRIIVINNYNLEVEDDATWENFGFEYILIYIGKFYGNLGFSLNYHSNFFFKKKLNIIAMLLEVI